MNLIVEQKQNLSNFFLLPLIKRSAKDFVPGKFVNSYLDIESFQIVVEVEIAHAYFKDFTNFDFAISKGSTTLLYYDVPLHFHEDVAKFVDGKYSEFSEGAKTYIRKYGKLRLKHTYSGQVEKSVWLHVLDRSDELRSKLEKQLGVELPEDVELASKPSKNNFINK